MRQVFFCLIKEMAALKAPPQAPHKPRKDPYRYLGSIETFERRLAIPNAEINRVSVLYDRL